MNLIIGLILGFAIGVYLMYIKGKKMTTQYLDKLLVNSMLKDAIKELESKKTKKTKK